MKKIPITRILLAIILTVPSILWFVRFFSWEDNRICADWKRISHWNPNTNKPTTWCNLEENKTNSENKNSVLVPNPSIMVNQNFSISMEWPNNWMINKIYTCQWEGKFPEIKLTNIPTKTKSLALIIDDPDAPWWIRNHLLLANIEFTGSEKTINNSTLNAAIIGKNSRGKNSRWAPCPPTWIHRYFFRVFSLDNKLNLKPGFTKEDFLRSSEKHILEKKELIWLYKKQ